MGGDIQVESEKGRGTTFFVRLPLELSQECHAPAAPEAAPEEGDLSDLHVLLVEDNELNREIALDLLESRGVSVESAEDGVKALDHWNARPAGWFDAILMDIRMPRLDGLQTTRLIRSSDRADAKRIPIIAMTANAFDADREAALAAGVSQYLIKPLDAPLLFSTLQAIRVPRTSTDRNTGR